MIKDFYFIWLNVIYEFMWVSLTVDLTEMVLFSFKYNISLYFYDFLRFCTIVIVHIIANLSEDVDGVLHFILYF